jgi:1-deoxy-D-xylulose-5-phosphate synthase
MSEFYINSPSDIKDKTQDELKVIAQDIREFLIKENSITGGHLGSNLGIVELTMALHIAFDSPTDKFLFDVGHQGYVHKILTGRASQFDTLRQYEGLSGFLKMKESAHDVWEAGHSSTSISGACGYAYARDLNKTKEHIVAVIGDGSMTNGMVVEAMNHISALNQKVIIILNDNEMSISSNVGFIDDILKNLQYNSEYEKTKNRVKKVLKYTPFGNKVAHFIASEKSKLKQRLNASESFFNLMGFEYYGPVDGHDFKKLNTVLEHAKNCEGPVLVHIKTEKGLGYEPAQSGSWHGTPAFDIATGIPKSVKTGISYSRLVANGLDLLMQKDEDIVVISPAMLGGSELDDLHAKYPNRLTDVGIAEEHAVTFAAGLALAGKKPFLSIYSTFLQRGYDQVFHDMIRQNTNVVIGLDRAGLVGDDGETHQGIYDISYLSHMHNITIAMGKDDVETLKLLELGFNTPGVYALRYPRGGSFITPESFPTNDIEYGTWDIVKKAKTKYVITYGSMVNHINDLLTGNDEIGIINARFIKPLDEKMLKEILNFDLCVVEEHTHLGGLNTLINDFYNKMGCAKNLGTINLGDQFIEQGNVNVVLAANNLYGENLKNEIEGYFNGKN